MFRSIIIMFVLATVSAFPTLTKFSRNIDLGKLGAKEQAYLDAAACQKRIAHSGFNFAPEIGDFFLSLQQDYQIETAIETGTSFGDTTKFLAASFDDVHTIEVVDETFLKTKESLKDLSNVHFHLGSSETVLSQILPTLRDKKVIFYLDAHWEKYWPLLDELDEISKTHKDNCIIVIDDFKVPNRDDIRFDHYDNYGACSYKFIKKKLANVFSNYDYYYLIPKNLNSRAKFVAIPKSWHKKRDAIYKPKFEIASNFLKKFKSKR